MDVNSAQAVRGSLGNGAGLSQWLTGRRGVALAVLAAAGVGAWLASYLYGGLIDPREVAWLLHENDPLQHYMGWHFFRRDEWQWPLGAMSNLASELKTSIVYTDSIPLLAIPLKLLHGWLPDPFQYLGLVMLANLMLNAGVACGLLCRCGVPAWAAWLGSVLFVSLPMAVMRGPGAHGHEALSAHWLLLLGIWLVLWHPRLTWGAAARWMLLLTLAVLIHFYLFFMVGVMWAGWWLRAAWVSRRKQAPGWRRKALLSALLTPGLILMVMWTAGYFHLAGGTGGGGYGVFSAELLTYVNPLSGAWFLQGDDLASLSYFLPGWTTPVWGQYEGQAYAGLGALGLLLAGGSVMANRGWACSVQRWPPGMAWLLLLGLGMFIFAMSDRIVVGYRVYDLGYRDWLWPLPDLLRSSGRLVWPLLYVLLIAALTLLAKTWSPRRLAWTLLPLVVLQWADLRGWHGAVHDRLAQRLQQTAASPLPFAVLRSEGLDDLWASRERLIALPVQDISVLRPYTWLAAQHDMSINVAHLARVTPPALEAATEAPRRELRRGRLADDAVYVLTSPEWAERVCLRPGVQCRTFEPVTLAWSTDERINDDER